MVGAKDHFADLRASPACATTWKPWCSSNKVALCQATLSIGLYLLLEGPNPTSISYPGRRRINL
jgi:hypothetical protein